MMRTSIGLSAISLALLATGPAGAQQRITLHEAVQVAQRQGYAAQAARSAREAAQWSERAFESRLLPQLTLAGQLPDVNRRIIPVVRPDGSTVFVEQSQMQSSLGLRLSQQIRASGGEVYVTSGLSRLDVYGDEGTRRWTSSPVAVGFRQGIFRPNALKWSYRLQDIRAEIAERQYLEAREDVAINTATAFFDVYAARMAVENAAANVAVNDTLYALNAGRFEVGKIGENDLLQSELALLRARNAVDAARLEHERALASLRLLMNLPAGSAIDVVAPTDVPAIDPDPAVAQAEALRNRSQMSSLELQATQARRDVSDARLSTGFGADVSIEAGLNQTAPVFGEAYRSLLDQQRLGVQVEMPLVQWGGRRATIEAARAEEQRVAATGRATRETTEQEARFAALQLTQSQRQLAIAAKADTVATKRFEVAKNRYVIGRIGMSDLYIAQNEKDAARLAYVQALRGYWIAYYRLRRLTLYDFAAGRRIGQ